MVNFWAGQFRSKVARLFTASFMTAAQPDEAINAKPRRQERIRDMEKSLSS
jgi:hypothetical protein